MDAPTDRSWPGFANRLGNLPVFPACGASVARFIKKRSKKAGLPPGTLIHIGEKTSETTRVTLREYDEKDFQESRLENFDPCFPFKKDPTVTWVNVDGIHQVEVLEKLGACFSLHPLVLEDILNTDQRPKMEEYGDDLYIVLKMLVLRRPEG